MKNILRLISVALCVSLLTLTACSRNLSPNNYYGHDVGVASKVLHGTIISKRVVKINNASGIGTLAGATAGGAAGSMIGTHAATNVVGAVGGVLVGGAAGYVVDKAVNSSEGYEYIIKLTNGHTISVVQAMDIQFNVNQRVLVIYGEMVRIIPDDTVSTPTKSTKNAKK